MSGVNKAAARLQRSLSVPAGGANTMAYSGAKGTYIRVLLDPCYRAWKRTIPSAFEGYKVIVDWREPVVANS
jgi:hypothetical protein